VKVKRLTNDSVAPWQDTIDYPIEQYSIWEKSGHDLPDQATESSSLSRKIKHAGEDKLNCCTAGDTAFAIQNPLTQYEHRHKGARGDGHCGGNC